VLGRVGDMFGKRLILLVSLLLFGAGGAVAAVTPASGLSWRPARCRSAGGASSRSASAGRAGTDRWIMTGGFGLGVLAGLLDEFPSMKVAEVPVPRLPPARAVLAAMHGHLGTLSLRLEAGRSFRAGVLVAAG
jgi:hypothetical protein